MKFSINYYIYYPKCRRIFVSFWSPKLFFSIFVVYLWCPGPYFYKSQSYLYRHGWFYNFHDFLEYFWNFSRILIDTGGFTRTSEWRLDGCPGHLDVRMTGTILKWFFSRIFIFLEIFLNLEFFTIFSILVFWVF